MATGDLIGYVDADAFGAAAARIGAVTWNHDLGGEFEAGGFTAGPQSASIRTSLAGISDADAFGSITARERALPAGFIDSDAFGVLLATAKSTIAGFPDPDSLGASEGDIRAALGLPSTVSYVAGSFTTDIAGNTITGLPDTPVAIIFFSRSDTNDDARISLVVGFAAAALAGGGAVDNGGVFAAEPTFTTNAGSSGTLNSSSIGVLTQAGAVATAGHVASLTSDGFTVEYSAFDVGNEFLVHFIAIYGSGVDARVLLSQAILPSGLQATTGAGFAPTSLIGLSGVGNNIIASGGCRPSIGFFDGTTQYASAATFGTTGRAAWQKADRFILSASTSTVIEEARVASLDADGFTLDWSTVNAAAFVVLALSGVDFKVGTFIAGSAGPQSVTGLGGQPLAALFSSVWKATSDPASAPAKLAISGSVGSTSFDEVNASNASGSRSITGYHSAEPEIMAAITGVASGAPPIIAAATLTSFDPDGFTWTWNPTDGTAAEIVYAAFLSPDSPGFVDPDAFGTLVASHSSGSSGFINSSLIGVETSTEKVTESSIANTSLFGLLNGIPVGRLTGISSTSSFGMLTLGELVFLLDGFVDPDSFGVLISPHRSLRRTSRMRPLKGAIARSRKQKVNGIVADVFDVIVIDEPADIQDRSGSYFQQDIGRLVTRRMVGYFDLSSGIAVGDRFVMSTETYLVVHLAEKAKQIQADLERIVNP